MKIVINSLSRSAIQLNVLPKYSAYFHEISFLDIQLKEIQHMSPDVGNPQQLFEKVPEVGDVTVCVIPPSPAVITHQPIVQHLTDKPDSSIALTDLWSKTADVPVDSEPIIGPLINTSVSTDDGKQISSQLLHLPNKSVSTKNPETAKSDSPSDKWIPGPQPLGDPLMLKSP